MRKKYPTLFAGQEVPEETEPKFNPFSGTARRLDGKPVTQQTPPSVAAASRDRPAHASNGGKLPSTSTSQSSSSSPQRPPGKLIFGSSSASKETKKAPAKQPEEPPKKEQPKFQAFSGKSYSLRG